ncbi:hypothetical protein X975_17502, partial [Stegodyphus mimosarum]
MGILLHLISFIACLQMAYLYPLQEDINPAFDSYRMRLTKKESFYPFKESLLSSLSFLDNPREGAQSQRKKAVDSTFIRFGRSSSGEGVVDRDSSDDIPASSAVLSKSLSEMQHSGDDRLVDSSSELQGNNKASVEMPRRFIVNHNGCRVSSSQEIVRALMNDRNCIQAFQKVKRENVNDTFIRFGKREAPREKEFEPLNSNEGR